MSQPESIYTACKRRHCNCIVCGNQNPMGLGVTFHVTGNGDVSATFRGNVLLQGYEGILHGGIIAALLDASMTHCLFHHGVEAVTGSLDVRFVKPVPCDALLTLHATLTDAHPPLFRLQARLTCDRHIMARAKARFMETHFEEETNDD